MSRKTKTVSSSRAVIVTRRWLRPSSLAGSFREYFFVSSFLCSCSHQSEEIRRHQHAVDHESSHLEEARSSCALRWSLSLVAASYFFAGCLVVLMEAAAATGRLKIRQLQ